MGEAKEKLRSQSDPFMQNLQANSARPVKDGNRYDKRWYDTIVWVALLVSYLMMVIGTLIGNEFMTDFFSMTTSTLAGTLIMICLSRMGSFTLPSFLLGIGIYMWALADLITFVSAHILHIERPGAIIDTIFLLPNYFFGASVAVYFLKKLKGRAFYKFLVDVFSFTVISLVIMRKFLIYADAYRYMDTLGIIRVYLYFFVNFFILIMIFNMTYMIAVETGLKGTNTMILGIFLYIMLDFPYNYLAIIGKNPEIPWLNLIYMLCMILMAHGIFHQIRHKHVFRMREHELNEKTTRRTRIMSLAGIAISIILFLTGVFDQSDLLYLLIAIFGYWVTTASFYTGELNEQLIKQQDLLTGLYNRRYSTKVLERCVKDAKDDTFCVYCIDLNHFKPINDTYGHDMGDRVLKEFGDRMNRLPEDYVSFRTGGDEFMVIRKNIMGEEEVREGAGILLELFHTPMELETYMFNLSGSIGGAIYRIHTTNTEDLIRYADAAMYVVKHSGRKDGFRLFDHELITTVEKHRDLELRLRNAVPSRDFILYYQPQIDNATEKVIGAEVFPRLKGKGNEIYSVNEIIPVAEEAGIMSGLGIWIAEESISKLSSWIKSTGREFNMTINLAPLQLLDMVFIERLKSLTKEYSVSPKSIRLDISNEVMMGAAASAKETLRELRDFGFPLSLNDFGGGNINLSHILDCGFQEIHISNSLISRSINSPEADILINSIIAIADAMGISASAVGIETKEQAEHMKKMKLISIQGFYYGRPVPAAQFEKEHLGIEGA